MIRAIGAMMGFYSVALWPVLISLAIAPASWWSGPTGIVLQSIVLLVGGVLASALFVGRGWATPQMIGLQNLQSSARGFGVGALLGVSMAYGAIVMAIVGGSARVGLELESFGAYVASALGIGLVLMVAALAEELLFRGYPIARLSKEIGKVGASVAMAGLFLIAHGLNPDATVFGLVNIGLAALVLSAVFFGKGGLAAAWGLHVGWNAGLGILVDAPVSGVDLAMPMVEFETGGPGWFTGGNFGPEGGVVTPIAMLAALVWLLSKKPNLREDDQK